MRVVKSGRFLIRTGERQELAVLVMPAQEGDAQGCPGAADTVIVPRIDDGGRGASLLRKAGGYNNEGCPVRLVMVSCGPELLARTTSYSLKIFFISRMAKVRTRLA